MFLLQPTLWLTRETWKEIGIPVHKSILGEIKGEDEKIVLEFELKFLKKQHNKSTIE